MDRQDPHRPADDHRGQHRDDSAEGLGRGRVQRRHDGPQLQADQGENGTFEHEPQRGPGCGLGEPDGRRYLCRRSVTEDQPAHHDDQHSGGVRLLADHIAGER